MRPTTARTNLERAAGASRGAGGSLAGSLFGSRFAVPVRLSVALIATGLPERARATREQLISLGGTLLASFERVVETFEALDIDLKTLNRLVVNSAETG